MLVDERAIQEQVAAHVRRNAVLVEQIKNRGGDLERERPIDAFFHARTEDTAINLSRFLKSEGFREISISRSHDEDDYPWTVQASIARSISTFTSRGLVEYFVGLASGFGVIYDGWGTALDETPPTL